MPSSFVTPLRIEPVETQTSSVPMWRLLEGFQFDIGFKGSGNYVRAEEGFETDFASSPRATWSIIPPWGKYGKGAVIHDKLCDDRTIMTADYGEIIISRKMCDDIFMDCMIVLGVPEKERNLIYSAVRAYAIAKGIH